VQTVGGKHVLRRIDASSMRAQLRWHDSTGAASEPASGIGGGGHSLAVAHTCELGESHACAWHTEMNARPADENPVNVAQQCIWSPPVGLQSAIEVQFVVRTFHAPVPSVKNAHPTATEMSPKPRTANNRRIRTTP
jgi:hypothetical protein